MLLIYCEFAILVLRAQGGLLWLKIDYCMVRSYGIHWKPMETALLDNYPEVLTTLSYQQKPHYHCYVLVYKGTRLSFQIHGYPAKN